MTKATRKAATMTAMIKRRLAKSMVDPTRLFHIVGLISALALGVGFVTGLISVGLSWRINEQQKHELEKLRTDAQRDVENARIEAKERTDMETARVEAAANVKIAEAKKEAGRANERAEETAQENLKLRIDLENSTAESRARQAELAREQQKLTKEQQKTALAQTKAAAAILEARGYLSQVRSFLTPRTLSSELDLLEFSLGLKIQPPGAIDIIWAADFFIGEPEHFAKEIAEALKKGGWTINKLEGVLVVGEGAVGGLKIVVRDLEKIPPRAIALSDALGRSGFVVDFIANGNLANDEVRLMILRIQPEGGKALQLKSNP
jgi:hypothetical protein